MTRATPRERRENATDNNANHGFANTTPTQFGIALLAGNGSGGGNNNAKTGESAGNRNTWGQQVQTESIISIHDFSNH